MFWNKYPYSDFHEMNLDWIIARMMELHHDWDEFKALNEITFSGAWNITEQYPAWTVVNVNDTLGYISIKPVPSGIPINNTDYWRLIVNYTAFIADLQNRVIVLENEVNDLKYLKRFLTPEEYGAVGDGVTDDGAAFQAVINAASDESMPIVLRGTVYKIEQPLTIYQNTRIFGWNMPKILFDDMGANPCINIQDGIHTGSDIFTALNHCTIEGISFTTQLNPTIDGYPHADECNNVLFSVNGHSIIIKNIRCVCFDCVFEYHQNSYLVSVIDSDFSYNMTVLYFRQEGNSGERMYFDNCIFSGNDLVIDKHEGYFHFNSCSFDYNNKISEDDSTVAGIIAGSEIYENCHIEWANRAGYKFTSDSGTLRTFNNCMFFVSQLPMIMAGNDDIIDIKSSFVSTWSTGESYLVDGYPRAISIDAHVKSSVNVVGFSKVNPLRKSFDYMAAHGEQGTVTVSGNDLIMTPSSSVLKVESTSDKIHLNSDVPYIYIEGDVTRKSAPTVMNVKIYNSADVRTNLVSVSSDENGHFRVKIPFNVVSDSYYRVALVGNTSVDGVCTFSNIVTN